MKNENQKNAGGDLPAQIQIPQLSYTIGYLCSLVNTYIAVTSNSRGFNAELHRFIIPSSRRNNRFSVISPHSTENHRNYSPTGLSIPYKQLRGVAQGKRMAHLPYHAATRIIVHSTSRRVSRAAALGDCLWPH